MPLPHVSAGLSRPAQSRVQAKATKDLSSQPTIATVSTAKDVIRTEKLKLESEPLALQKIVQPVREIVPAAATPAQPEAAPVPESAIALPAPAAIPTPQPAPVATPAPVAAPLSVRPNVSLHPRIIVLSASVAPMHAIVRPPNAAFAASYYQKEINANPAKEDYINAMRAAGYDDLDKLIAMKVQGITPEYAHRMAQLGYGKPSADDLISLKMFKVTPETVEKLRAAGIAPATVRDLIAYQMFKVTPEFVAGMKDAGFPSLPTDKLVSLRIQNVTPEFAKTVRQKYPDVTVDQLVQLRIFHIDDEFIASAKSHGFDSLTIDKLVKLRISGLLDDNSVRR